MAGAGRGCGGAGQVVHRQLKNQWTRSSRCGSGCRWTRVPEHAHTSLHLPVQEAWKDDAEPAMQSTRPAPDLRP